MSDEEPDEPEEWRCPAVGCELPLEAHPVERARLNLARLQELAPPS